LDDGLSAGCGRRALLAGLAAALAATAMPGTGALAQEAKPKEGGAPGDEKPPAQAPRAPTRRGISSPDRDGTRGGGRSFDGGESVPGGLPGSAPTPWSDSKPGSAPGGLPGAR
jgi:hypothetical protein